MAEVGVNPPLLGRRMEQRHKGLPAGAQDHDERGRREHQRLHAGGPLHACQVARRRPLEKLGAEHEPRLVVLDDEGAVGKLVEPCFVAELGAACEIDAFAVQLRIDRICSDLAGVELSPEF